MYLLIVYIQKSSGAVIRGLLSVINVGGFSDKLEKFHS